MQVLKDGQTGGGGGGGGGALADQILIQQGEATAIGSTEVLGREGLGDGSRDHDPHVEHDHPIEGVANRLQVVMDKLGFGQAVDALDAEDSEDEILAVRRRSAAVVA